MSRSLSVLVLAGVCAFSLPAAAETQISVFGGMNSVLNSDVKLRGAPGVADESRSFEWDGGSFDLPPYWGVRGTYWMGKSSNWGFAIDYVHSKALADLGGQNTYDRLEFTDGNNILLFDVLYRFNPTMNGSLVPYIGAGVGAAIPHVEVTLTAAPTPKTYEYQLTGIAAQVLAGLEYKLNDKWSVFAEGRFSYSNVVADLEGGGNLKTHLWQPQLAIGLSYRF